MLGNWGLFGRQGATAVHDHVNKREGVRGLREIMPLVAHQKLLTGNILCGLGIVENAYDQTMQIRGAVATQIAALDKEMLAVARVNMPRCDCCLESWPLTLAADYL